MLYKERLEFIRERLGYTKIEMAELIGVSDSLYARYMKEKQIMPIKHINTVCNFFNVSIDYAFGFTNIKQYSNSRSDFDKALSGSRIKGVRRRFGLKQGSLAKYLNTAQSNLSAYERGINIIATPYLYMICKKYGVSADWLLGKVGDDDRIYYTKKDNK